MLKKTMQNKQLAIAIPTYNRSEILKENLLYMMVDLKRFNIPIYISDDSPGNETREMIEQLKQTYEYLFYSKNTPSLGHDDNCFTTLNLPSADYIWYLGDAMMVANEGITQLIQLIEQYHCDFYITNATFRKFNLETQLFKNKNNVFQKLAWHVTLTGACIYKRDVIASFEKIEHYKNFPQTSIILKEILSKCNLYYLNEPIIIPNENKKQSYWSNQVFDVFAKDWVDLIKCIYKLDDELVDINTVIKSHSKNTGVLGFKKLLNIRAASNLSIGYYVKNYKLINLASHLNPIFIILISIIPRKLIFVIKSIHSYKI